MQVKKERSGAEMALGVSYFYVRKEFPT